MSKTCAVLLDEGLVATGSAIVEEIKIRQCQVVHGDEWCAVPAGSRIRVFAVDVMGREENEVKSVRGAEEGLS